VIRLNADRSGCELEKEIGYGEERRGARFASFDPISPAIEGGRAGDIDLNGASEFRCQRKKRGNYPAFVARWGNHLLRMNFGKSVRAPAQGLWVFWEWAFRPKVRLKAAGPLG
jgi:hypothetical protein